VTIALAAAAFGLVLIGLAGWVCDIQMYKSLLLYRVTMKANAAVCLLLLAVALRVLACPQPGRLARLTAQACAGVAAGMGGLTLVEYGLGVNLDTTELLFRYDVGDGAAVDTFSMGRMAPDTSLVITLAGLVQLVLLHRRHWSARMGQLVSLAIVFMGLLRMYGFLYRAPELERLGPYTAMSLQTAVGFVLLGTGMFLVRPDVGLARLVTEDSATAMLGRWMLTATLLVPPLVAWGRMLGQDSGLYGTRMGITLLVVGNITVFTFLTFWALRTADRLEKGRLHAERKVRDYAQLQTVMDHTPAVVFLRDLNGRYLVVNTQFERVLGASRDDVVGLTNDDLLPQETADDLRRKDQQVQAAGDALQFENVLVHDGVSRCYLTTLFPVADASGRTYAVGGVSTDITERAEVQCERERLHQRFRALLEAAPDAVVIVDQDGRIVLVNARTEVLFGYSRTELLGGPVELLIPERLRHRHVNHLQAFTKDPKTGLRCRGSKLYGRRKDGSEFPVETSLSLLETEEGMLISVSVRDITARRQAEQRLSELASMVESCGDAMASISPDGTFTFWNAAAERIFGFRAEEVIGRSTGRLTPSDREAETTHLVRRLCRGQKIEHWETVLVAKGGRLVDVELTLWPVRDSAGTVVGISVSARDITDRKRQEAKRRQQYEQQRNVAMTLQRSLMALPPQLPAVPTAVRYVPATQGAGMGGDWFDLIPLEAGRVGMLIGDVMGRGLEAAAVMGHLRPAAHALAKAGLTPEELMQALDSVVDDLGDQLVTCCYLIVDLMTNEITLCSAGHLPVLLVAPDATVTTLPAPVSVPLGVGGVPHQQATVQTPAGSALVLYTDGLVESHDHDLETRLKTLITEVQNGFADNLAAEQIADHLLDRLIPDPARHDDDVTLLIARLPAATATIELPAEAAAVATGRRFIATAWRSWSCDAPDDTARLLVSELLGNAVRHGRGPVNLQAHRSAWEVTVEVTDCGGKLPERRTAGPEDESGRGLFLIEALADHWGIRPDTHGKTTWFTLRLPTSPR
jgi:PAS domain S-box-containing protein